MVIPEGAHGTDFLRRQPIVEMLVVWLAHMSIGRVETRSPEGPSGQRHKCPGLHAWMPGVEIPGKMLIQDVVADILYPLATLEKGTLRYVPMSRHLQEN